MLAFAAPLFITAFSMPLLGESTGPHRWSAVVIGFIGVLIVVRPGAGAMYSQINDIEKRFQDIKCPDTTDWANPAPSFINQLHCMI